MQVLGREVVDQYPHGTSHVVLETQRKARWDEPPILYVSRDEAEPSFVTFGVEKYPLSPALADALRAHYVGR